MDQHPPRMPDAFGPGARGQVDLVTLGLDREMFAVPVAAVLEILDYQPLCRVPDAPRSLAGLIDVRGANVPVVDLRAKLGLPAIEPTASTRIIVLDTERDGRRLVLGVIADRVLEVLSVDRDKVGPPPDIGGGWRSRTIQGVGRRGEDFLMIFDLDSLFDDDAVHGAVHDAVHGAGHVAGERKAVAGDAVQ